MCFCANSRRDGTYWRSSSSSASSPSSARPRAGCSRRCRSWTRRRSRWIRCILPEYAARTTFRMLAGLFLSLVFTLTYATWAAKSERAGKLLVPILDILQSVPILGFISMTAVFFLSLAPGPGAGRRVRRDLRHIHQPSLEHGVQLLPVAAHHSDGTHRSGRVLPALAVDAVLAAGSAVRHAGADLEHDDVHVGRLVLRRRLRIHHGGTYHRCAARRGVLHRAGHRAEESRRHRLGHSHHAHRDSAVRPIVVPAAGRLGGPLPRGAGAGRAGAGFLGADHDAPLAPDYRRDGGVSLGGAVDQPRGEAQRRTRIESRPRRGQSGALDLLWVLADRGRRGAGAVAHRRRS